MTSSWDKIFSDMVLPTPNCGFVISPLGVSPSGWYVLSTRLSSFLPNHQPRFLQLRPRLQLTSVALMGTLSCTMFPICCAFLRMASSASLESTASWATFASSSAFWAWSSVVSSWACPRQSKRKKRSERPILPSSISPLPSVFPHLPLATDLLLDLVDLLLQLVAVEVDWRRGEREPRGPRERQRTRERRRGGVPTVHALYMARTSLTSSSLAKRFFCDARTEARSPPFSTWRSWRSIPIAVAFELRGWVGESGKWRISCKERVRAKTVAKADKKGELRLLTRFRLVATQVTAGSRYRTSS